MTSPGGCHLVSTCVHTQVHMYLHTQNHAHTHIPHSTTLFRIHAEIRCGLRTETGLRSDLLYILIGWIFSSWNPAGCFLLPNVTSILILWILFYDAAVACMTLRTVRTTGHWWVEGTDRHLNTVTWKDLYTGHLGVMNFNVKGGFVKCEHCHQTGLK